MKDGLALDGKLNIHKDGPTNLNLGCRVWGLGFRSLKGSCSRPIVIPITSHGKCFCKGERTNMWASGTIFVGRGACTLRIMDRFSW